MAIRVSVLLLSTSLPDAALRSGCSSSFRPEAAPAGNGGTPIANIDGAGDGARGHKAASSSVIRASRNGSLWVAEATPTKNFTCWLGGYTVNSGYELTSMAANGFTTCTAAPMSEGPMTGDCARVPDPSGNAWVATADGTVSKGLATSVVTPLVPGRFATAP